MATDHTLSWITRMLGACTIDICFLAATSFLQLQKHKFLSQTICINQHDKTTKRNRLYAYLSHLYLLFPSRISGWKNFWKASLRELLFNTSTLISIISSTLLDSFPQARHLTWLCKAPPKISLTTVLPLKPSPPPLLTYLRLCCCNFFRRRHVVWQASMTYRRNSCASSCLPKRKCSAKTFNPPMILPGVSRVESMLRDRTILFSSRQNGQSLFLSCCARKSPVELGKFMLTKWNNLPNAMIKLG